MVGNNEIDVCDAQMCEIAQMWVDSEFKAKPKVTSVKANTGGVTGGFTIKVTSEPRVEEAGE